MENPLQNLVSKRLAELQLGPVEAATKAGLERTYIRDIVEGKKKSIRSDKIEALAKALQLDPSAFGTGAQAKSPDVRYVRITGHVQAGAWAETWELPYDEQHVVPVPADPELASFTLHAAEVRGPSMNRRYPEGTIVVFTDIVETMADLLPGHRYIIERERADGLREATVKKLWRDETGKFWLLPESDDPRFQEPIPLNGEEGDTIRIVGRVRYSVSRE